MSEDNPFVDEGGAVPTGTAPAQAEPGPISSSSDRQSLPPGSDANTAAPLAVNEAEAGEETDEVDEPESAATPAAPGAKPAVNVKTKIEFDVTAEPYTPGQCTVIVALAIRPEWSPRRAAGGAGGPLT